LLGSASVIRSSKSQVSACCNWLLTIVLSSEFSSLHNFRLDCKDNTSSCSSSVVSQLSLYVRVSFCMCIPLSLLGNSLVNKFTWKKNAHATVDKLLGESFPVQSVSYQRKVGD
jgi:hypothetical protein